MEAQELADHSDLVCIDGLPDTSVLCALANISSEKTPAAGASRDSTGGTQAEFTEVDLERRIACAKRALPGRYYTSSGGSFDQQLRCHPQFLADIGLPVRFIDTADGGRCIEVSAFDAGHWPGAARQAVDYLRQSGSSDTRAIRGPIAAKSPLVQWLISERWNEAVSCRFEDGICVYRCRFLSTGELLGLLNALRQAHQQGRPEHERLRLSPQTPRRAYDLVPYESRIIGAVEPSAQLIADAIALESGLAIDTFGDEVRIVGIDQVFAGELNAVVSAWSKRQTQQRTLAFLTLGSLAFLYCLFAVLSEVLGLGVTELSEQQCMLVVLLGVATSWMPLKLLYMLLVQR